MKTLDIMHKGKPTYLGKLIIDFCAGMDLPWERVDRLLTPGQQIAARILDRDERWIRWVLVCNLDHKMPAHRN